jgi:LAO/AO transport system kinase
LGSQNPQKLADAVRSGDRRSLARAITLIESTRSADRETGIQLLDILTPHAGKSIRIGISGVPGVGKSTFIENFGNYIIDQGHKIAVLAVDPSSAISGGSILGDKTRMETLSQQLKAYIRPSPAGRTLGGVTRYTRETICLVEAAGFDVVMVETVGVGQSEIAVAEMTDIFMLMLLPGGGDELQGIKRGIIELADLVVVNKADGDLAAAAGRAAADYRSALGFLHPRHPDWEVPVETCSALENKGLDTIWQIIERYRETMSTNGELEKSRAAQAKAWLWNETAETLIDTLKASPFVHEQIAELEEAVATGKTSPWVAAQRLVKTFLQKTT